MSNPRKPDASCGGEWNQFKCNRRLIRSLRNVVSFIVQDCEHKI